MFLRFDFGLCSWGGLRRRTLLISGSIQLIQEVRSKQKPSQFSVKPSCSSVYMLAQRRRIDVPKTLASPELLNWLKPRVIALGVICIPLSLLARRAVGVQIDSGRSLGFEVSSYLILFSLSLVGIAILIATLWKSGAFHTGGGRFVASLLFIAIIYLTFQPSMRFQFLGWFVAATIILSSGLSFVRRAQVLVIGLVGAVCLFAVAGALRNAEDRRRSWNKAHGKGSPLPRMPTCSMALCFSGRSILRCSVTVMAESISRFLNVLFHAPGGRTSQSVAT